MLQQLSCIALNLASANTPVASSGRLKVLSRERELTHNCSQHASRCKWFQGSTHCGLSCIHCVFVLKAVYRMAIASSCHNITHDIPVICRPSGMAAIHSECNHHMDGPLYIFKHANLRPPMLVYIAIWGRAAPAAVVTIQSATDDHRRSSNEMPVMAFHDT